MIFFEKLLFFREERAEHTFGTYSSILRYDNRPQKKSFFFRPGSLPQNPASDPDSRAAAAPARAEAAGAAAGVARGLAVVA